METSNQSQFHIDAENLRQQLNALEAEVSQLKQQQRLLESQRDYLRQERDDLLLQQQNIQDRRAIEELASQYQGERERLELAQKAGNIGTFEWFIKDNLIIWTPELEALYGLPPGGFEGKYENWASRVHPADFPQAEANLSAAIKGGPAYNVEFRVVWPNKTERWMLAKGDLFLDEQGQPHRLIGVNIDVTERKRWEQRIHFLERVSTELASSIDYEVTIQKVVNLAVPFLADWCSLDLEDDAIGTIRRVATAHSNPVKEALIKRSLELFPYTAEQLDRVRAALRVGQTLCQPVVDVAALQGIARSPEHLQFMLELNLKSSMLVPLFSRGELIGAFTIGITESDRRYDESDVALAEEMARRVAMAIDNALLYREAQLAIENQKEIDRQKDSFLSIAGHELRTPLTSLKGYTQIFKRNLEKKYAGECYEQTQLEQERKMADVMLHQIDNMNNLISEMLDVSRIQQGKLELRYQPAIDLVELVGQVVEQQRAMDADKHQLIFQASSPRLEIAGDPARLEQVLNNLITNACKYSLNGKTVTINVQLSSAGEPNNDKKPYSLVSVRDEGIGISAEYMPHLFEQFYRVQSDGPYHVDGLGLGLYISQQIVQQHGGQLWAESQLGQGSTFYLCLPLTQEQLVDNS